MTAAVKSAFFDRPKDATGDYGFIAESDSSGMLKVPFHTRFWTVVMASAVRRHRTDGEDPTHGCHLQRWAPNHGCSVALRLFEEYAPLADGLENRDMHRHVKAHFHLTLALRRASER